MLSTTQHITSEESLLVIYETEDLFKTSTFLSDFENRFLLYLCLENN